MGEGLLPWGRGGKGHSQEEPTRPHGYKEMDLDSGVEDGLGSVPWLWLHTDAEQNLVQPPGLRAGLRRLVYSRVS